MIYFYAGEVKYKIWTATVYAFYVLQDLILSDSEQYCPQSLSQDVREQSQVRTDPEGALAGL